MRTPRTKADYLRNQFIFSKYGTRFFQKLSGGVVGAVRASNEELLPPAWSALDWREVWWSRHSSADGLDNGRIETGPARLVCAKSNRMADISRCGGV
jgi:hypothetical protein